MLDRLRGLAPEVSKFVVVGGIGFIADTGVFNALRYFGEPGLLEQKPLSAKAVSVVAATLFTYLGNRHWTWRHRRNTGTRKELVLFFVLNGIGMVIALACLAFSHYALDLRSALADNISANLVGLLLAMVFRFWSYRTYVFKAVDLPEAPLGSPRARVLTSASSSQPRDVGWGRSPTRSDSA